MILVTAVQLVFVKTRMSKQTTLCFKTYQTGPQYKKGTIEDQTGTGTQIDFSNNNQVCCHTIVYSDYIWRLTSVACACPCTEVTQSHGGLYCGISIC